MSTPYSQPVLRTEREHDLYDEGWAAGRASLAVDLEAAFRAGAAHVMRPPSHVGEAARRYAEEHAPAVEIDIDIDEPAEEADE